MSERFATTATVCQVGWRNVVGWCYALVVAVARTESGRRLV